MIRIENLHKAFEGKPVLRGIHLEIADGETVAVLGKSGSGKTVLLKHIVGLMKPDQGHVWVDEWDVPRLRRRQLYELRRRFGYVFQASALFDSLTVYENLALPLRDRGVPEAEIRRRVLRALERVDLQGAENLYPSEMSGGMQKRASVARALVIEPEYLLYDEPTTGLDPVTADRINDLMIRLKKDLGITAVLVTHDMRSALRVADRLVLLSEGRIRVSVPVAEVFSTPDPELQDFLESIRPKVD